MRVAIVVGLAAAIASAAAAWAAATPRYSATGQVQIAARVPPVLDGNGENDLRPMFLAYIDSQAALMRTRRVLDVAEGSAAWRALSPAGSPPRNLDLVGELTTHVHPDGRVDIRFRGDRAEEVHVAVNSVLHAYTTIVQEQVDRGARVRTEALVRYRDRSAQRLAAHGKRERLLRAEIAAAAVGEDRALRARLSDLVAERADREARLAAVERRLEAIRVEARVRDQARVRILSLATPPVEPFQDQAFVAALIGGVAGFVLAAGGAWIILPRVDR